MSDYNDIDEYELKSLLYAIVSDLHKAETIDGERRQNYFDRIDDALPADEEESNGD